MRTSIVVAAVAACLIAAGCSTAPPKTADPNAAACAQWSAAHNALDDTLASYSGSGFDPKVDSAEVSEVAVIADVLPQTSGDVNTSLADLQTAWQHTRAGNGSGTELGTAEYVMGLACQSNAKGG